MLNLDIWLNVYHTYVFLCFFSFLYIETEYYHDVKTKTRIYNDPNSYTKIWQSRSQYFSFTSHFKNIRIFEETRPRIFTCIFRKFTNYWQHSVVVIKQLCHKYYTSYYLFTLTVHLFICPHSSNVKIYLDLLLFIFIDHLSTCTQPTLTFIAVS